mgnify:FL=1
MILALDTSGDRAVVALTDDTGARRFAGVGSRPRAHAEELAPLVAQALAVGPATAVVAGRGPGSFTGLRVGLAFAGVFGWARGIPVKGVCSLDPVAVATGLADGWVVLDARRGELFAAPYRAGVRAEPPVVLPRAEAAGLIGAQRAVGDTELLTSDDRRSRGTTVIDPDALATSAARVLATGADGSLQPDYLRRPDVTWSAAHGVRP